MRKTVVTIFNVVIVMLFALILVSCVDPIIPPDPETYTVTFNADNGTNPVVVTVEEGETVSEPTPPVKAGFTFDAWYLGDTEYDFSQAINSNITLIAHWDEIIDEDVEYTVTFNAVGGLPITAQTVESGEQAAAPTPPTKTHFVFDEWTLNGTPYNFEAPVTSNITLVAKYSYVGIPNSPSYFGRTFNADFDQTLNNFASGTLNTTIAQNASIATDQPYVSVGYSGTVGNNPDGALWKQAGSENAAAPAFQYLVLRLRGFAGASVNDLSIGFRYGDNHEVLVVPFTETFDPNLEENTRELDGTWYNYVISITDTLDGKSYVGKTGHSDIEAGGVLVGFHLMNTSGVGSGILELKDAYYSKVPNPVYPYEGSNYAQNRNYWSDTVGVNVGSYVTIGENGFYGDFLEEGANEENTHVVLRLKQASPGTLDLTKIKIAPVFDDGETQGTPVAFSDLEYLPTLGSGWLNLTIAFEDIYDGDGVVAGYKLINEGTVDIAISQSFLTYLGQYEAVDYPLLDLQNAQIFDNFNRATIGTTPEHSTDNVVALNNGFSYLISYAGLYASTIGDGYITFDSTGGDYADYVAHSASKANVNEYRYLVFKYKLNDSGTLDNFRMIQNGFDDLPVGGVVYASQWVAGLGLPSIPEDMETYPYKDGDWTFLVVDLLLTEGLSTDFGGFHLFYTGSSLSIDAIFFANQLSSLNPSSQTDVTDFADGAVLNDSQYDASFYDSPTSIVLDEDSDDNFVLYLPEAAEFAQYWANYKEYGEFLQFDIKLPVGSNLNLFRLVSNGVDVWQNTGNLIAASGLPLYVSADGQWHTVTIDVLASGLQLTPYWVFANGSSDVYIDNISFYSAYPTMENELIFATFESGELAIADENQHWQDSEGTDNISIVADGDGFALKLDGTDWVQYATGIKGTGDFLAFNIKVGEGSDLTNLRFQSGVDTAGVMWVKDGGILLADGTPLTVDAIPDDGNWHYVVIQWTGSGLAETDTLRIALDGGSVIYFDNFAWWQVAAAPTYPVLEEDFNAAPIEDDVKYWWAYWEFVANGAAELNGAYAATRLGSPQFAGANFLTFEVKLAEDGNGDTFRLELGVDNIINFSTLVEDGYASALTEEFQTVTINLADYVANLAGLEVIGFHINNGDVIVDNLTVSVNEYGQQMRLFNDEPVE